MVACDERVERLFAGDMARWREAYEALIERLVQLGPDVAVVAAHDHVSLRRGTNELAVVVPCAPDGLEIALRLDGVAATPRFQPARMQGRALTHRVRLSAPSELDAQVHAWLRWAYAAARGRR